MDPMPTKLIDPETCAPKDRIDEEAQTHDEADEKTRWERGPYVTLLVFAFVFVLVLAFVLLFTLENVLTDVREIKETLYARAREPVDSDAIVYADPNVAYAYTATDIAIDERDPDPQDATATDATADFGDLFAELLVKYGGAVWRRR